MNNILKRALTALVLTLALSCVSTGAVGNADSYYDSNAKTFSVRTLDNGVQLIVKRTDVNRVLNLRVVFKGGSAAIPAEKAGLENIALALLGHGSKSYSYDAIQKALYEKSAGISQNAAYDYGSYNLNCIDKYFGDLFGMYIDGIMNPTFDPEEFKNVLSDAEQVNEERFGDPDQYAKYLGTQAMFVGHPYASDPQGTEESLAAITLDDVKAWHAAAMDSGRILVVAVGSFDVEDLYKKLNATIGTIGKKDFKSSEIPTVAPSGDMVLQSHDAAEGVAYVQGYFRIPNRADKDYVPFAVAMDMLDDIYFNIVREKYGACYSVATLFRTLKASYGILWVYQTTKPADVKSYIDESVALMAGGKLILMKDSAGKDYVYASVADRLQPYKSKYINAVYASQKTNADVAENIVKSVVYFGDHTEYLRIVSKIRAVTADDVMRVLKTYLLDGSFRWVVVSDDGGIKAIDKTDYVGFLPAK